MALPDIGAMRETGPVVPDGLQAARGDMLPARVRLDVER